MSRGSPVIPVRIPADLLAEIDAEVERQNATRAGEPYDRSSWIRQALRERIDKLNRSRKGKAKAGGAGNGEASA